MSNIINVFLIFITIKICNFTNLQVLAPPILEVRLIYMHWFYNDVWGRNNGSITTNWVYLYAFDREFCLIIISWYVQFICHFFFFLIFQYTRFEIGKTTINNGGKR